VSPRSHPFELGQDEEHAFCLVEATEQDPQVLAGLATSLGLGWSPRYLGQHKITMAPAVASSVPRHALNGPVGDGKKPGPDTGLSAKLAEPASDHEKDLVHHVVGPVVIATQAPSVAPAAAHDRGTRVRRLLASLRLIRENGPSTCG
jgi:hypothetical protein